MICFKPNRLAVRCLFVMSLFFLTKTMFAQRKAPLVANFLRAENIPKANGFVSGKISLVEIRGKLSSDKIKLIDPIFRVDVNHYLVNSSEASRWDSLVLTRLPANNNYKASLALQSSLQKNSGKLIVRLALKDFSGVLYKQLANAKDAKIDAKYHLITLKLPLEQIKKLLDNDELIYADVVPQAQEEVLVTGMDLSATGVSNAHLLYPQFNGAGINISVKEGMYDVADLDLLGKTLPNAPVATIPTDHATTMATLALGAGNTYSKGRGVAPMAKLAFSDFRVSLMPDDVNDFKKLQIGIQNHSYGTDVDNVYGIEANAYDQQLFEADTLVHVFSSGNKGTATPTLGAYAGIPGVANLTGNFKQAKNVITVGGIDREDIIQGLSSSGPAYDGRVKPELVALGEDGTSGAAALVSGATAVLKQAYKSKFKKNAPLSAIKGLLINSADDLGAPHVDFKYGFGKLNLARALNTLQANGLLEGVVTTATENKHQINIPNGVRQLKATLVWVDPPAAVNVVTAVVNHLNFYASTPSNETVLPWVANEYPQAETLMQPAKRMKDLLNNVQQITIDNPPAGAYMLNVDGQEIKQNGRQAYTIVYSLDYADEFTFTSPQQGQLFYGEEDNYVRWHSTLLAAQGDLEVSYDNGANWETLAKGVALGKGFYSWASPDRFSNVLLRMVVGDRVFQSKTFSLSKPLLLKVAYHCGERLGLRWNQQPGAKDYTIYQLLNNQLQPLITVTDTLVNIELKDIKQPFFAVQANGDSFVGLKSYTIDYRQQQVACYVENLQANLQSDGHVDLSLLVGTSVGIKNIMWEKMDNAGVYGALNTVVAVNNQLNYTSQDNSPRNGLQFYRVTFEMQNGETITSAPVSVKVLDNGAYAYYPNPVHTELKILSNNFENYNVWFYNILGQVVLQQQGRGNATFDVGKLPPGLYAVKVLENQKMVYQFKMIKQ